LRSSASSLLALSAVALALGGCGREVTFDRGDVELAFAAEGVQLRGTTLHRYRSTPDLGAWVDGAFLFLQRFAQRQVEGAILTTPDTDVNVLVSPTPQDAARLVATIDLAAYAREGMVLRRRGNVVVFARRERSERVDSALDALG
jgi:hypothetical protein